MVEDLQAVLEQLTVIADDLDGDMGKPLRSPWKLPPSSVSTWLPQ